MNEAQTSQKEAGERAIERRKPNLVLFERGAAFRGAGAAAVKYAGVDEVASAQGNFVSYTEDDLPYDAERDLAANAAFRPTRL